MKNIPAKGHRCKNFCPPTWTAPWRDWHRGHGCHLDPLVDKANSTPRGFTPPEEGKAIGSATECLSCADLKAQLARLTRAQEALTAERDLAQKAAAEWRDKLAVELAARHQGLLNRAGREQFDRAEAAESRLRALEAQPSVVTFIREVQEEAIRLRRTYKNQTAASSVEEAFDRLAGRVLREATPRARTQTESDEKEKDDHAR